MKKSAICLSVGLALAIVGMTGCATCSKGPSDEELVKTLTESWKAAILEKNFDLMMATFSEDFAHDGYEYEAANKAALREFVDSCDTQGYFDDVEISFEEAVTTIEGDTATVTDIEYMNDQGSVIIELTAKKANGVWLIADMYVEGL